MALTTEQMLFVEQRLTNEKKSLAVAYILYFFLGSFGGHRFYLGRFGTAIMQMLLFLLATATAIILIGYIFFAIWGLWMLYDLFFIPAMLREDTEQKRQSLIRHFYS